MACGGKTSNLLLFLSAGEKIIMHCSLSCERAGWHEHLQRSFNLAGTLCHLTILTWLSEPGHLCQVVVKDVLSALEPLQNEHPLFQKELSQRALGDAADML